MTKLTGVGAVSGKQFFGMFAFKSLFFVFDLTNCLQLFAGKKKPQVFVKKAEGSKLERALER